VGEPEPPMMTEAAVPRVIHEACEVEQRDRDDR